MWEPASSSSVPVPTLNVELSHIYIYIYIYVYNIYIYPFFKEILLGSSEEEHRLADLIPLSIPFPLLSPLGTKLWDRGRVWLQPSAEVPTRFQLDQDTAWMRDVHGRGETNQEIWGSVDLIGPKAWEPKGPAGWVDGSHPSGGILRAKPSWLSQTAALVSLHCSSH